ncbi:MAG: ATP-binding protein, partial [Proteobacteria bacterium]|nr:ATP-binding protein [Pseudomonadota bacterium]
MSVSRSNFADVSEADLRSLIAAGTPEGADLEYKRDMYGGSDADVKEFLKDVSSLANSQGGHLLIGVDESAGAASALAPLPGDPDKEVARLENLIRDGIEPRLTAFVRAIPTGTGFVIGIRVARSSYPPHRISARKTNRIFVRGTSGSYEASIDELRTMFTL